MASERPLGHPARRLREQYRRMQEPALTDKATVRVRAERLRVACAVVAPSERSSLRELAERGALRGFSAMDVDLAQACLAIEDALPPDLRFNDDEELQR